MNMSTNTLLFLLNSHVDIRANLESPCLPLSFAVNIKLLYILGLGQGDGTTVKVQELFLCPTGCGAWDNYLPSLNLNVVCSG